MTQAKYNELFTAVSNLKMLIEYKTKNVPQYVSGGAKQHDREKLELLEKEFNTLKEQMLLKG